MSRKLIKIKKTYLKLSLKMGCLVGLGEKNQFVSLWRAEKMYAWKKHKMPKFSSLHLGLMNNFSHKTGSHVASDYSLNELKQHKQIEQYNKQFTDILKHWSQSCGVNIFL